MQACKDVQELEFAKPVETSWISIGHVSVMYFFNIYIYISLYFAIVGGNGVRSQIFGSERKLCFLSQHWPAPWWCPGPMSVQSGNGNENNGSSSSSSTLTEFVKKLGTQNDRKVKQWSSEAVKICFFPTSLCGVLVFCCVLPSAPVRFCPLPSVAVRRRITLSFSHTHTHNVLTHTTYSHAHTTYSHTHTQLSHTHTTYSHTHNFLTRNFLTHNSLTHTTLSHRHNSLTHTTYS